MGMGQGTKSQGGELSPAATHGRRSTEGRQGVFNGNKCIAEGIGHKETGAQGKTPLALWLQWGAAIAA
ncbi:MAG: hypothetical protein NTX79_03920 [Candidatus Micrarchaeota archaeon]|nr:hypothetical protein [Candidatus Micrarchaeota archaeon]